MNPEYIKLIYDDGEVWRGRFLQDESRYCSDGVMLVCTPNSRKYELQPCEWLNEDYSEIKGDATNKVEIISGEEYWTYTNGLMIDEYDQEIQDLENQIKVIKERRDEFVSNLSL
ncbi:hypothetical protein [Paenibacillus sp. FSL H3-0333]|uniref:hypothetical protein n=1 Tax=Paenibacillus sp. FSL H3-0333 TaxID=2921373 RepID=UPI0030FAD8A2